jgi:hypothetical protein
VTAYIRMSKGPSTQELEPRRKGAEAPTPDAERTATPNYGSLARDETLHARLAVYLIEREAIRWRRLQWIEANQQSADEAVDRERLAKYRRPQVTPAKEPSRIQRVGFRIKSFFRSDSQ